MDRYSPRSRRRGSSAVACIIVALLAVLLLLGSGPIRAEFPRDPGLAEDAVGLGRGYAPPPFDVSHLDRQWPSSSQVSDLAARWDWREEGAVTRVQNQGSCGACYAFATLASLESQLLIQGQGLYDLSENNLAECNYQQTGCEGGNVWISTNQLSTYGAATEACDPWNPADQACNTGCPPVLVGTDVWVLGGRPVPPTEVLKGWLRDYGPLFVSMDSGTPNNAWGQEFNGYDGSYTLYAPMAAPSLNHAVLLVGWDDNLAHAGGTGAWIVKNSWGTGWGGTCGYGSERGYFAMAYGSAGLGSNAAVVRGWDVPSPGGTLLYHDEAGPTRSLACGNMLQPWGLARLTPPQGGCATQVEIWTVDATTDVDVFIYDSFDGAAASGLLWKRENLSFAYAGYHSIPIDPPLPLQAGNDVNVKVKFGNANTAAVLGDNVGPVGTNQSYWSCTGADGDWTDLGMVSQPMDIGIRLRVGSCSSAPTTSPTPSTTATPTTSPGPSGTATPTATHDPQPPTQTATAGPSPTRARFLLPILLKTWLVVPPVPTPTPTLTPPPGVTVRGKVNYRGAGIGGIILALRHYDGAGWSTRATTTTLADGTYQFPAVPPLTTGQRYYVRYANDGDGNPDNPAYLWVWQSFLIESGAEGYMDGGEWDIDDVVLVTPDAGATVTLPTTFQWTRRPATPSDSYALGLYDPNSDLMAESQFLGYVDGVTVNTLPPGFAARKAYKWYVAVYAPDGGDGESYDARRITFTNTGASGVSNLSRPGSGREGDRRRMRADPPPR